MRQWQQLQQLQQLIIDDMDERQGCEWMKNQDWQSIARYSLEEVYELIDAINSQDLEAIKSELADLCLHLMIYAELGRKSSAFDLEAIAEAAIAKQQQRKPIDVDQRGSAEHVHAHWHRQKREQQSQTVAETLQSIPKVLPALVRCAKLQETAALVGFDFEDHAQAVNKWEEECAELRAACADRDKDAIASELGDVLFATVSLARQWGIDPERALRDGNQRFIQRFSMMETLILQRHDDPERLTQAQWLALWREVKRDEGGAPDG